MPTDHATALAWLVVALLAVAWALSVRRGRR